MKYKNLSQLISSHQVARSFDLATKQNKMSVAILPVGCTEQHGPYLPIQTDSILAEGAAQSLAEKLNEGAFSCTVFPTVHFTPTQTNVGYPGTVSVNADPFAAYAKEICRGLKDQFDILIIVNGHGPAEFRLKEIGFDFVSGQIAEKTKKLKPVLVVSVYEFDTRLGELLNFKPGRHADWREFLGLYQILGPDYFTNEILKGLREFQMNNDFTIKGSAVLGVPMQYRSVEGVQGDPMPFDIESVPELASKAWQFIVNGLAEKTQRELKSFFAQAKEVIKDF